MKLPIKIEIDKYGKVKINDYLCAEVAMAGPNGLDTRDTLERSLLDTRLTLAVKRNLKEFLAHLRAGEKITLTDRMNKTATKAAEALLRGFMDAVAGADDPHPMESSLKMQREYSAAYNNGHAFAEFLLRVEKLFEEQP